MAYTRSIGEERSEDVEACREKALYYLTMRDHGSGELYRKLCERFTEPAAAEVLARLCAAGLVDDSAFALHRARYLMSQHKSRRQVVQTLGRLSIDRADIDAALEQLYTEAGEEDPERKALAALVEKQYSRKLAQGKQDSVLAALCRRGFAYSAAKAAIEEYSTLERESENV